MWVLIISAAIALPITIYLVRNTPDWNLEPLKQWLRQNEADKEAAKRTQEPPDTPNTGQG